MFNILIRLLFSMKKRVIILLTCIFALMIFSSCEKEEEIFDETLLTGKWKSGTLYDKYLSNGSGSTWDTSDDVTEEEAQLFTWSLTGSELKHIHILEMGATVPKVYTLTELTGTTLKYEDGFGKRFSFTRVD